MTSLHQSLRLSRRFQSYHQFRRSSRKLVPSRTSLRSFASCPSNHDHLDIQDGLLPPSNDDYALVSSLIDTANPVFLASSHTPAQEVPWWDISVSITDVVHTIHDTTGWPYAASIAAVTVLGRFVMVPIAIWHLRNNPWEPHLLELKNLYDRTNDPRAKARYKAEIVSVQRQFPKMNRFALPLASVGTTLFMWIGLRRMATLYPADMATGGIGWFVDLTQPDPYLFLPILSNFLMFSAHELGADETGRPRQETNPNNNQLAKYAFRGITAGLFCMWFFLPSSILCFWIPHSALSCVQTVVFSQPAVIQSLGFGRGGGRTASSTPKTEDPGIRYFHKDTTAKVHSKTTAGDAPDADAEPRKTSTTPIRINKKTSKKSGRRKK